MSWIELKIRTQHAMAEILSDTLTSKGALAVTVVDAGDQPIYEPDITTKLWDEMVITGLFDNTFNIESLVLDLKSEFPTLQPEITILEDQAWERAWMADFQPMAFGSRLWIIPSHQSSGDSTPAHQVILDPGLAFGTGKHPTTALCLEWLDQHIVSPENVIDYGCGSGILGIAALKLGAKKVYAIDHDPQALIATQDNAKRNGLAEETLICLLPEELKGHIQAEVLIANILSNPLITLAETFATLLSVKGKIVLSGILKTQAEDVIKAYSPFFNIIDIIEREEWVRIDGYKILL